MGKTVLPQHEPGKGSLADFPVTTCAVVSSAPGSPHLAPPFPLLSASVALESIHWQIWVTCLDSIAVKCARPHCSMSWDSFFGLYPQEETQLVLSKRKENVNTLRS